MRLFHVNNLHPKHRIYGDDNMIHMGQLRYVILLYEYGICHYKRFFFCVDI